MDLVLLTMEVRESDMLLDRELAIEHPNHLLEVVSGMDLDMDMGMDTEIRTLGIFIAFMLLSVIVFVCL